MKLVKGVLHLEETDDGRVNIIMNDNLIYNLFMYETSSMEEFTEKLEHIYGLPNNSTLAKDIYNALHLLAMELE